jgi:2'-5' RNA ligase
MTGIDEPAKLTDRLFFAIFPGTEVGARIAQLAQYLRSEHGLKGKPLEAPRLHITLYHLGDYAGLPQDIVAAAIAAAASVAMPPFEVVLDRVLSFPTRLGNRPFVLAGHDGVDALTVFQRTLCAALDKAGIGDRVKPQYTPHVTLLYDNHLVVERPVGPVHWTVREFMLVHSLVGKAVYVPLARWSLALAR